MSRDPITKLQQARALDPVSYVENDYYLYDQKHVVGPNWQCIAPASSVAEAGDVISREIAGVPIMVVRSANGELNGFYNICLHRAGPVTTCDAKGLKRLRCGYHGWAYDLNGNLKIAPEMREAECFDAKQKRLHNIDVKEWGSMIFARLNDANGEGKSFDSVYGSVAEKMAPVTLDGLVHRAQQVYDVQCNWKVYIDNFLEGYHLPFVHPGLTQAVDYAEYTTELGEWWSLQRTPVEEDTGAYGAGEGLYFFVYPNVMLNIMPGRLQSNRVVPTGIASCKVEFDFYYAPGSEGRADEDLEFSAQVQEEDRSICEHVQKGLTSGVYSPGRLSPKRESGVWHFQNLLRGEYQSAGFADYASDAYSR